MMASGLDGFKPCSLCTRTCFDSHGDPGRPDVEQVLGAPSFLKLIGDSHLSSSPVFFQIPTLFMEDHGHQIGEVVTLQGPRGWVGQVNVAYDTGYGFRGGWKQFRVHHNLEAGDHIVCTLVCHSKFSVKIYDKYGCEKVLPCFTPNVEPFAPAEEREDEFAPASDSPTRKSLKGGRQSSVAKPGGKRKTQNEAESTGKKMCVQSHSPEDSSGANGDAETEIENQRKRIHELMAKPRSRLDPDNDHDSPEDSEEIRLDTPAQEGLRSEDCSSLDSEEKSTEMEDGDEAERKWVHRSYHETEMAMEAARAYETANPSTILVVNKTAITKSQTYFSAEFARKWFPEEKTQLVFTDEIDNKWSVTFLPTATHMVLGAGWAKFVRDNRLQKGDVVVFELEDPSTLTLVVRIFRVKDYTLVKVGRDGIRKTVDGRAVPTLSKTETLIGNSREDLAVGSRKDDRPTGTSESTGSKSPQPPMLPQYAAVAKYFASQRPPVAESNQEAGNGRIRDVESPNEANDRREGAGVTPGQSEPFVTPQKERESSAMPQQGNGPTPIERATTPAQFSNYRSLFPVHQAPQQAGPFAMLPAETTADKSFLPPRALPQQQVQFVMAPQGSVPYAVPPQLGAGPFVLAPQGQVPYMVSLQEGAPFVQLEQAGLLPSTRQQEGGPYGTSAPPGMPKETDFPGAVKDDPQARMREKYEVKPRRRRPPTHAERERAMDEAFEFWTPNPHVMVALKPSHVYAGFSLTLRWAALPEETRDVILLDSTGRMWRCKWLVNTSGRRLSAGWKRFAVDHLLEEGDVCVFEMIDRVNLTLLIHIFRLKLEDNAAGPIEIQQSDGGQRPADPAKRKRKSRAKPKGLVPPLLPNLPADEMEKLSRGVLPLGGANLLPSGPSYKYMELQSRRRPVSMEERRRAELAARNLKTKNPSVMVVMRNSSVYCHFLVSIPSSFAKQWLPRKLVKVTLCDYGGHISTARWAGNRKRSARLKSFREFSVSHRLEEGDALVFELMDANPNNPVFLVHIFRVVELPNIRISPKDWESHYKLDVMTVNVVQLQDADGDSRSSQAYHELSDSDNENNGFSQAPWPSVQLSPKSKTKAIYSAILRRKTIADSSRTDLGEGSLQRPDNASHTNQGNSESFGADKAIHISQLERLGRQRISGDIMPHLKRMPGTDGPAHDSGNSTHSTQAQGGEPHTCASDRAGTEAVSGTSRPENGTTEAVPNMTPLVAKIPKAEPVEFTSPPKERTKVRRKTTMRRETRQDDFLQITLGDPSIQETENPSRSRQENLERHEFVFQKAGAERTVDACKPDGGYFKEIVPLVTKLPKMEAFEEADVLGVKPNPFPKERQAESQRLELLETNQGEGTAREVEPSIHDRQITRLPNVSGFDKGGADPGSLWLQSTWLNS